MENINRLKLGYLQKNSMLQKGMFDKRFMYEESFGTPLLMQLPGTIEPKTKIDAMVQNLDLVQTFLDFAEASERGEAMQGESFKGLIDGSINHEDFRAEIITIVMIIALFIW